MWINYRFRHAVRWEKPIPIAGESIAVADLERGIIAARLSALKTKKKGRRCLAEVRLVVYNAETGEEYSDDNDEIPANTSVIVRLLTQWSKSFLQTKRGSQLTAQLSSCTTEGVCVQDNIIRARQPFKSAWHYLKTPPGYVCHRCHVRGHYIQACPTNDDPSYDIKGSKYSTGAYKDSWRKDAVSSTATLSFRRFPKELNCPLCKEAMKEAVLMRCCFSSFCDKCIRDRVTLKSVCACGARNVTVDDIIPNKTLRETVKRFLSLTSGSSEEDRSCCLQAQGPGSDLYSKETEVPLPNTMESAPTKASKESVAVSGVTYSRTCKQWHAPASSLTTSSTDGPSFPSSLGTPASMEVQQKYTVGGWKRN